METWLHHAVFGSSFIKILEVHLEMKGKNNQVQETIRRVFIMTLNTPNNIDSVALMLNDLEAERVQHGFVIYPQESPGLPWVLNESLDSLSAHAAELEETAISLGIGGRYSPGVALLAIHLQEKIATAPTDCSRRIAIADGRFILESSTS